MNLPNLILVRLAIASLLISNPAQADTSVANILVAGVVPTYFSVTSQGSQSDLDLTPGTTVSNRVVGTLHFKFNENVQSMTVSSSTNSGLPEDTAGNAYKFGGTGGFKVAFTPGCTSVDPGYSTPFTLTNAGVDVKSALAGALINSGIEEDCQVTASYKGTTTALPLAGRFEMNITITMVSM